MKGLNSSNMLLLLEPDTMLLSYRFEQVYVGGMYCNLVEALLSFSELLSKKKQAVFMCLLFGKLKI